MLFNADTSKLSEATVIDLTLLSLFVDKQGVLQVDDFYRILQEEGPINLKDAQKARIKKLFVNLKDNTLPYSTVLKSLEFNT